MGPSSANLSCTVCTYNKAHDHGVPEKATDEMRWSIETNFRLWQVWTIGKTSSDEVRKMLLPKVCMNIATCDLRFHNRWLQYNNGCHTCRHQCLRQCLKKICVREIAHVYEWNESNATRERLKERKPITLFALSSVTMYPLCTLSENKNNQDGDRKIISHQII